MNFLGKLGICLTVMVTANFIPFYATSQQGNPEIDKMINEQINSTYDIPNELYTLTIEHLEWTEQEQINDNNLFEYTVNLLLLNEMGKEVSKWEEKGQIIAKYKEDKWVVLKDSNINRNVEIEKKITELIKEVQPLVNPEQTKASYEPENNKE